MPRGRVKERERRKNRKGDEKGIYSEEGGYSSTCDEPNGQQWSDALKTQIESHFYDVNGWVPWKTLG